MSINGVPLDLGRTERFANRAQRRALARRDGGCVFPGCGVPATLVRRPPRHHWEHGGPTDMSNLVLLCRYHHGVTHRHGWSMVATADQTLHLDHPHRTHPPQPTPPRPTTTRRLTGRTPNPPQPQPEPGRPPRAAYRRVPLH